MANRSTCSGRLPSIHQPESQSRAKWTTPLTKILVELLVEEVTKGNKRNASFNKKAWESVCDDFRERTGLPWDNEQLKSRYAALRKQYVMVKSMLDQADFRWDGGVIVASDDVWDRYIKEHPDSETVRGTICPLYSQLCAIFSLPGTRGKYNQTNGSHEHAGGAPSTNPCRQQEDSSSSKSEQVTDMASKGQKRGRKGVDGAIARAIMEMAAASKLRAAAIKKFNDSFSITDCVRALDELEGVSDEIYFAALELFDSRSARETFLSLKIDKRLTWLSVKCLGQTSLDLL